MEEVSGATTTLVADLDPEEVPVGNTYTIDDGHGDQSTYQDVTDIFDESQEPTLTLGSDNMADDIIDAPELPRDSSRENTPQTKRRYFSPSNVNPSTSSLVEREREFDKLRNFKVSVPSLDELNDASLTSGYKSGDTNTPRSPRNSSRQRRTEDEERFKTRTITKNDLSDSNPSSPCERKGQSRGVAKLIARQKAIQQQQQAVNRYAAVCGNFSIFLSFRFYEKSILERLEVLNLQFLPFLGALNFVNLVNFSL